MNKRPKALLAASLLVSTVCTGQTAARNPKTPPSQIPANQFVRQVIDNEIQAENNDHSHWMLRVESEKSGKAQVKEVVEAKDGDLEWLISENGRALSSDQQRQQEQRLERLKSDPAELQKAHKEASSDEERSQQMLKMLPDAFLFSYGARRSNLTQLHFKPNPKFHPTSHESEVFHAMEGVLWLDGREKRLAEVSGHLTHEVKFGGGLLGRLDPGGTFHVEQKEVQPGYWEMTLLNVNMKGKALFFKTIAVQQKMRRSMFRRLPDNLTVAQGIDLLHKEVGTLNAQAGNRGANQQPGSPSH